MASVDFDLGTLERATALSGILDQNIRLLENEFNVKIQGWYIRLHMLSIDRGAIYKDGNVNFVSCICAASDP